jgi:hypothetical protein
VLGTIHSQNIYSTSGSYFTSTANAETIETLDILIYITRQQKIYKEICPSFHLHILHIYLTK